MLVELPHITDEDPIFIDPKEVIALGPLNTGSWVGLRGGSELYTRLRVREVKENLARHRRPIPLRMRLGIG